jgi:uncharacterized protein (DUF1697 family)
VPKYVAFLRAINVGGHVVKMDDLRRFFVALGFANVETFIASGNVIFDTKSRDTRSLERKIEKHLAKSLGYEVTTFVRAISELSPIADHGLFSAAELARATTVHVGFLQVVPPQSAIQKLISVESDVDSFKIRDRELYWLCRTSFSDSKFSGTRLEKFLGMPTTLRNVNTVKRLAAKYGSA